MCSWGKKSVQPPWVQTEAFIISAITAGLLLLLAFAASQAIKRGAGEDARDHVVRRWWFIGLGIGGVLLYFVINTWKIAANLSPGMQQQFNSTSLLSIVACALIYFAGGFLLSKLLPNSNFGTIFSSKKKRLGHS